MLKEVKREIQILNFAVSKNENKNIGQLEGWTGWTLDPLDALDAATWTSSTREEKSDNNTRSVKVENSS